MGSKINVEELVSKLKDIIKNIEARIKKRENLNYDDVLNVMREIEAILKIKCHNSGYYDLVNLNRELMSFISYIKSMTKDTSDWEHHRKMLKRLKQIVLKYTDLGSNNEIKEWKRRVRKEITHRNGKPMLTRAMIRSMKSHTNPLEQLIIIVTNCFPNLLSDFAKLSDKKNENYIDYQMQEIALIRLLALCCGIQSMAEIMAKLDREEFIKNINLILGTDLKKFPCDDTISNVINTIKIEELEAIQTRIIKRLIESKTLDKYRLFNKSFYIVIDGSGLYSTRLNLGDDSLHKIHNKETDNEYIEYHRYVLEAKLVCGDYVFSFATEFVENANMNTEKEKQDCELTAAHRLLKKIRKTFPKLLITIGADALYVNKPFMDACIAHKMDYILRYKDTVMTTINEEFINIEKNINGNYEYVNDLGFGSGTKASEGKVNIIKYTEEKEEINKNEKTVETAIITTGSEFMFVTSLTINNNNYKEIVLFGRRRWKIENQGFKEQKSRVLNMEHIYTFDNNGTKVNYYFIQFAHTLLTLLYYGSTIIKKLKETKIEISNLLYQALLKEQQLNLENTIQIRFD